MIQMFLPHPVRMTKQGILALERQGYEEDVMHFWEPYLNLYVILGNTCAVTWSQFYNLV